MIPHHFPIFLVVKTAKNTANRIMEVHHLELLISCDLKNDELPQKMNSLTLKIACLE
jgi:hypothetical protein